MQLVNGPQSGRGNPNVVNGIGGFDNDVIHSTPPTTPTPETPTANGKDVDKKNNVRV